MSLIIFVIFSTLFALYVYSEKQIGKANELRFQSHLLSDELRHTSDDLSRMALSYVITGNPSYKKHFQEIIDIRDGNSPRPLNYSDIYWDADNIIYSENNIASLDMMKQVGFTIEEFSMLVQSKANSDKLTKTEYMAMAIVESPVVTNLDRLRAINMLSDNNYSKSKAGIIASISEFYRMVGHRTLNNVRVAETYAFYFRVLFILFGVLLIITLIRSYCTFLGILGVSIKKTPGGITILGCGEFLLNQVLESTSNERRTIDRRKKDRRKNTQNENKFYIPYTYTTDAVILLIDDAPFDCNAATLSLFGFATLEEFCQHHLYNLSPIMQPCGIDSKTLGRQRLDFAIANGSTIFEWTHKKTNNEEFQAEVLLSVININDESIVIATVRDITGRKQVEISTQAMENRLNVAMNCSDIGIWDCDLITDTAWRSLKHDQIFGYDSLQDEWGTEITMNHIVEEDRWLFKKSLEDALVSGVYTLECRINVPDRSIHFIYSRGKVIYDENGSPIRILGTTVDITKLKNNEFQLSKFKRIIDSTDDAVISKSLSGVIESWNVGAMRMFGYTDTEVIGCPIRLFIPSDCVDEESEIMSRINRDKHVEQYETMRLHKDGRLISVSTTISPIFDDKESVIGFASIAKDITIRKKTEVLLQEAILKAEHVNLAKSEFLANMSHEIRTPMNAILGMAEILSKTVLTEKQRMYVDIFQESGNNLLKLINDILDMSKVEAGQLEFENKHFSLQQLMNDVFNLHSTSAANNGLTLILKADFSACDLVNGDPTRVSQCLTNLIANAIKFSRDGEIYISMSRIENDMVQFSVSDTGIGISDDKLEVIFEPFSQADNSTTRKFGGTGLGLTITKRLVNLMGGNIYVESGEGKGATLFFSVKLPNISIELPVIKDAIVVMQTKGLNILMAEDNPINVLLIEEFLEDTLHTLDVAKNGLIALEKLRNHNYDIVLMDIQMPIMGGYEAITEIRRIENIEGREPIKIIAFTANAFKEDELRSIDSGCNGHITKPVSKKVLLDTLNNVF